MILVQYTYRDSLVLLLCSTPFFPQIPEMSHYIDTFHSHVVAPSVCAILCPTEVSITYIPLAFIPCATVFAQVNISNQCVHFCAQLSSANWKDKWRQNVVHGLCFILAILISSKAFGLDRLELHSGRYSTSVRLLNWYTPMLPLMCHPVSRLDPVLETRKANFKCSLATLWGPTQEHDDQY